MATPTHTNTVLDAIDGALLDMGLGPDAMRWAPPENTPTTDPPAVPYSPGCNPALEEMLPVTAARLADTTVSRDLVYQHLYRRHW